MRPIKLKSEKRQKHIMMRFKDAEYEMITSQAKDAGESNSAFIRAILTKRQPVFDTRFKMDFVREVNAIGHNFNQLVRAFHETKSYSAAELDSIRVELKKLNDFIREKP